MIATKVELLREVPLFEGLTPAQLEAVAKIGRKVFFELDEKIIAEGGQGHAAYLIMSGKAACLKQEGGETFEENLWPGTLVGELAMLVDAEHALTVVAKERLRALAIYREDLMAAMETDPSLAQHVADKLLTRLQALAQELRLVDTKLAEMESAA